MRRAIFLVAAPSLALFVLLLGVLMLTASTVAAHGSGFTAEENAWLNRQRAVDGMKCCDETDAHVGLDVRWRLVGGAYEVWIAGAWHRVPPGRMMRHDPSDPTPWPGQAILFHSPRSPHLIWCFFPEPLT